VFVFLFANLFVCLLVCLFVCLFVAFVLMALFGLDVGPHLCKVFAQRHDHVKKISFST